MCDNMYVSLGIKSNKTTYPNFNQVQIQLPFRAFIVGSSSSGKTNMMLSLIRSIGVFTKIWLCVKDIEEPLYRAFIESIQADEQKLTRMKQDKRYKQYHIQDQILTIVESIQDLPDINDVNHEDTNLIIFDDQICEKKRDMDKITEWFIRGRKKNCSMFFLSQSYSVASTTNIRRNCNIFILKTITSKTDIDKITRDFSGLLTQQQLIQAYHKCSGFNHGLLLDVNNPVPELRVRDYLTPLHI